MVLAGGASQRFPPDKLSQVVDGTSLLDHALASLPEQFLIVVVGAVREVARPVIFTSENPAGGGPAAALVAGLRRALEESNDVIVVLPADAPLGGQAAGILLNRLEGEPSAEAVVGVDAQGREQPLQLAVTAAPRPRRWWQPPDRAVPPEYRRADCSMRCDPGLLTQELAPAELWDIDTADQLLAWRLRSSAAVSSILDLVTERHTQSAPSAPVVVAIDGPSCTGKSILATALALRSGAAVVEGDDFYRNTLPRLSVAQRDQMSDAAVVHAVIDWERLRAASAAALAGQAVGHVPALRLGC